YSAPTSLSRASKNNCQRMSATTASKTGTIAIATTTSDALQIDANGALRSARYGDIYFNAQCGAEESMHVFIEGNRLPQRWRTIFSQHMRTGFVVGELGFGSGLNFLASATLWLEIAAGQSGPASPTLYYYATEAHPLTRTALRKVLAHYNPYPELSAQLLEQYPDVIAGDYLLRFDSNGTTIMLVLLLGESVDALGRLEHYYGSAETGAGAPSQTVDAWYLDGFAPAMNPAMWQRELFAAVARHSTTGSTAATFSVARQVRDNLRACGFSWLRAPGFGRKREMLCASFVGLPANRIAAGEISCSGVPGSGTSGNVTSVTTTLAQDGGKSPRPARANRHNNVFRRVKKSCKGGDAIVIGAGIAGCSSAARLAQDGWRVRVLDRAASGPAAGASGNRAAILYARTAAERSTLADWHEAAFHFAHHFYRRIGCADGLQGMLRIGAKLEQDWLQAHPEIEHRCNASAAEASRLAGVTLPRGGILYAQSGYLLPEAICRQLLAHHAIETMFNADTVKLEHEHSAGRARWHVNLHDGRTLEADAVVVACAHASKRFAQTSWLPLKTIRGQTTAIAGNAASAALRVPLCAEGYVTPAIDDLHECGASYGGDAGTGCTPEEHRQNLDNAVALLPALQQSAVMQFTQAQAISGRVALRCVTPDYLPLLGPVAKPDTFRQQFASIARNARRVATAYAAPMPGLYVNCGYGSHGFTSAPLLAELLVAEMSCRPLPLADTLRRAVHPSRFLLRALVRGKPAACESA
ncbi:MAG: FAD-dependent 5-carboxymethylaminomethyl-2-thiouridine(34) oxidoreductase MnmC, partial [Pseudomonadales bacterium]